MSELYEKWLYFDGNYAYTRFEVFRTRSGEMLFTNEHKATLSKEKSNTYIHIDEPKIFKDFFYDRTPFETEIKNTTKTKDMDKTIPKTKTKTKDMDRTIPKTKTEDKDMVDKINDKISIINETIQY